jgi:hypothetical protein
MGAQLVDIVPSGCISIADAYERLVQAAQRRRNPKRYEVAADQSDPIVAASEDVAESICYARMADALSCGALRVFTRPAGWLKDAIISPKAFAERNALAALLTSPTISPVSTSDQHPGSSETPCFLVEYDFERWLSAAMPKPPLRSAFDSIDAPYWLLPNWVQSMMLSDVPLECIERDACLDELPVFLRDWAAKKFLNVRGIQSGQKHTTLIPAIEWQHMQIDGMLATAKHHRFGEGFYTDLMYYRGQLEELLPAFLQTVARVCLDEVEHPEKYGGSTPPHYLSETRAWIDRLAEEHIPAPRFVRPIDCSFDRLCDNIENQIDMYGSEPATKTDDPGGRRSVTNVKLGRPKGSGIIYIHDEKIVAVAKVLLAQNPTMRKSQAVAKAAEKLGIRLPEHKDTNRIVGKMRK